MTVKLSLGFDVERPYGRLAESPAGKDLRERQLAFAGKLLETLDSEGVPRTLFILGEYLERCADKFTIAHLRQIYNGKNPLNEIQQHSYSHLIFRPVEGRADKKPITPAEFKNDLGMADQVLGRILDVVPRGLRTPLGYHKDLSDIPEILDILYDSGIEYVSSDLRGGDSLCAPLTPQRQPHTYENAGYPGIVEIPSHGWQDVIFTAEKSQKLFGREPDKPAEIIEHFTCLFGQAASIAVGGKPVYVSLCLHPWAIMQYDNSLEIQKWIIGSARDSGIEIVTYGSVADGFLP